MLDKKKFSWYNTNYFRDLADKGGEKMFVSSSDYPFKNYRSPDMFHRLREYLILKTGQPLGAKSIADDLNRLHAGSGFRTNDKTVSKYLDAMLHSDINGTTPELFSIKREYIKPHYNKGGEIGEVQYGNIYYFTYPMNKIKDLFASIPKEFKKKFWGHPSSTYIQRQTMVAQSMYARYGQDLKSGALVYRTYEKDRAEKKFTIIADFVVGKTIYFTGNAKSLLKSQKGKKYDVESEIVYDALCELKNVSVKIITMWDTEPQNEEYQTMVNKLPGNCELVHWKTL